MAAILDVIWGPSAYQRMVGPWKLDEKTAISAATWTLDVLRDAIAHGRRPELDQEGGDDGPRPPG